MREIDNNKLNNLNFKGIQKVNDVQPTAEPLASTAADADRKEIKDLANMPALGKTQVASDSIENDMRFLEKNPTLAAELNNIVDEYAKTHSEEETLRFLEKMHQEFVAKK